MMAWYPKTTFGQTALFVALLLTVNQVVSYLSITFYFIQPNYEQINRLLSNQVILVLNSQSFVNDRLIDPTVSQQTGLQLFSNEEAQQAGLGQANYYQFISSQLSDALDVPVQAFYREQSPTSFWLQLETHPDLWFFVPMPEIATSWLSPLAAYLIVIGVLSAVGGWIFVQRMNQPLQGLQKAAKKVGEGKQLTPLPLRGSSEIVAVTDAFNQMALGIRQLERDRNLMTAGISHDLRTPLTRLRLASEMMSEEQSWLQQAIVNDIEDMDEIIDQFIAFARHDQDLSLTNCAVNPIILDMVALRRAEPSQFICLELEETPLVRADELAIKRVLENLIQNAFRYGSSNIHLRTFFDPNLGVCCTLRDFGEGLHQMDEQDLFTPFKRGDETRRSPGSGLGLAICKRLIEQMDGKIWLRNHHSRGVVAGFSLPAITATGAKHSTRRA